MCTNGGVFSPRRLYLSIELDLLMALDLLGLNLTSLARCRSRESGTRGSR